jgi:hypothetical protein
MRLATRSDLHTVAALIGALLFSLVLIGSAVPSPGLQRFQGNHTQKVFLPMDKEEADTLFRGVCVRAGP